MFGPENFLFDFVNMSGGSRGIGRFTVVGGKRGYWEMGVLDV